VAGKRKRQAKCPNDPFLQGNIDVVYDDMIAAITALIEGEGE
jgi:hypothetical protein